MGILKVGFWKGSISPYGKLPVKLWYKVTPIEKISVLSLMALPLNLSGAKYEGVPAFEAMEKISETIGVPVSKVYGVVTFYSQFTTEPKGKHVIAVCLGTACYVNGSQTILDLLCEMTGCEVNSTSPDGLFSIDATRCVGACGLAPVVSVDGIVFGCTKQLEDLKMLVLDYLKEEAPC